MTNPTKVFTLAQLAAHIDAQLVGDAKIEIYSLNTLQDAKKGELAFLANPRYQKYLPTTQASAVIVHNNQSDDFAGNKLIVPNPYLAYAQLTSLFAPDKPQAGTIHTSAIIDSTATIAPSVSIGAHSVIEADVLIDVDVVIGPGSIIGKGCKIGPATCLAANVTLYQGVTVGSGCMIHSGAVIGADGFGFAPSDSGWVKIHQLGGVTIGNDVEIGAGTTIDRGALGDTFIGDGVILDNQVQIAHNVSIGDNTAIAGCAAIAGSTTVGKNCTIAGGAGLVGHISLCDGVHVTAMSMITKSIDVPGSFSSGTGMDKSLTWRKNAARFSQLDSLAKRLAKLEKESKDQ